MRNETTVADEPYSYEALYQEHHQRILQLCRWLLSDPHEAEDVAQDVWLRAWREAQRQDPEQALSWGPWLTRVAINACRDRRRSGWWKRWRMNPRPYEEEDYLSLDRSPEQGVLGQDMQVQIWRAVRELSGRQQEVFVLRHMEGWSTDEVATALALSPGSVKRHLYRAVQHLRGVFRGEG